MAVSSPYTSVGGGIQLNKFLFYDNFDRADLAELGAPLRNATGNGWFLTTNGATSLVYNAGLQGGTTARCVWSSLVSGPTAGKPAGPSTRQATPWITIKAFFPLPTPLLNGIFFGSYCDDSGDYRSLLLAVSLAGNWVVYAIDGGAGPKLLFDTGFSWNANQSAEIRITPGAVVPRLPSNPGLGLVTSALITIFVQGVQRRSSPTRSRPRRPSPRRAISTISPGSDSLAGSICRAIRPG